MEFFRTIGSAGSVADLGILAASFEIKELKGKGIVKGLLAGWNSGLVEGSYATGAINSKKLSAVGGLIGMNDVTGIVERSQANVDIDFNKKFGWAARLVAENYGWIDKSFANGNIELIQGEGEAGGLVYTNYGNVTNSYAMGSVLENGGAGGLIGLDAKYAGGSASVKSCYSTAAVTSKYDAGGVIADDENPPSLTDAYWDLDTSGITNPSQGAGSPPNDPGITGLTDIQLKSALPTGFDPKIWAQDAKLNHGYPYLIDNPPPDM